MDEPLEPVEESEAKKKGHAEWLALKKALTDGTLVFPKLDLPDLLKMKPFFPVNDDSVKHHGVWDIPIMPGDWKTVEPPVPTAEDFTSLKPEKFILPYMGGLSPALFAGLVNKFSLSQMIGMTESLALHGHVPIEPVTFGRSAHNFDADDLEAIQTALARAAALRHDRGETP